MAIVRTVLTPSNLVQPQHGLTGYEQDQDSNWNILNSLYQTLQSLGALSAQVKNTALMGPASGANAAAAFRAIQLADLPLALILAQTLGSNLGIDGVISGFELGVGTNLTPTLTAGVLSAQGLIYAPAAPPVPAAPASATSYLFYNATTGFYWQSSAVAATSGDALIGSVTTSASAVTAVTNATKIFGKVSLAPGASGNFTVGHLLGRSPVGASLLLTSTILIVWQATQWDGTNLYLNAAGASTGVVIVW